MVEWPDFRCFLMGEGTCIDQRRPLTKGAMGGAPFEKSQQPCNRYKKEASDQHLGRERGRVYHEDYDSRHGGKYAQIV